MRIYLAGPSAELERVKAAASEIEAAGHVLTEPWWERIEAAKRRGWASDADVPAEFMLESAERNEAGICRAGRIVMLCRSEGGLSSGCAYELGFAKRTPFPSIVLVGNPRGHVGIWTDINGTARVHLVASVAEALSEAFR